MSWNDRERLQPRFRILCDAQWDEMTPRSPGARHCARCDRVVHMAHDEAAFDDLARAGACVFVQPARGPALVAQPDDPSRPEIPNQVPMGGAPMLPPEPRRGLFARLSTLGSLILGLALLGLAAAGLYVLFMG